MRVNATLKTVTTTTDNIGGIRQEFSFEGTNMKIVRIEEKIIFVCRQITADDVAVLQLQLVGGTFVMVTINSQVRCSNKNYLHIHRGDHFFVHNKLFTEY